MEEIKWFTVGLLKNNTSYSVTVKKDEYNGGKKKYCYKAMMTIIVLPIIAGYKLQCKPRFISSTELSDFELLEQAEQYTFRL